MGDFVENTPTPAPQSGVLPTTVTEVTTDWFSGILQTEVTEAKVLSVVHGSSSTIVVDLTYAPGAKLEGLPSRLFLKGGFNPELIAIAPSLLDTYRREAEFYHHLSPKLSAAGMRLPKAYYTAIDSTNGQGIVGLEDLRGQNCSFGTPVETWPVDRVLSGVEQLAILHATTWKCHADPAYAWLQQAKGGSGLRGIILELTKPATFAAVAPRNLEVLAPEVLQQHAVLLQPERIVAAFKNLWAADDAASKFQSFIHGDPHIDNTYMTATGEPGFLDWQTAASGNCFHDVSYFVASALTVADRRAHEQRILRHYLDTLERHGVEPLDWEEAWAEYRMHLFHGYVLCLAQPAMQPQENIWALVERYITAIVDHSVIDLLERTTCLPTTA